MSVCDKHGAAVHPDEYAPPSVDEHDAAPGTPHDWYLIGCALLGDDRLTGDERERLLGVLHECFRAAGV